jgi:cysteine-rich repeat protein
MRLYVFWIIVGSGCYDDSVLVSPYERTTAGGEVDRRHNAKPPPPGCGDGTVDEGEACDDGNRIDNDGCNNACEQAAEVSVLRAHPLVDAVAGSRRFEHTPAGLPLLAPFQPVRLSGRSSTVTSGSIAAYEWSIDQAHGAQLPLGSGVRFDDASKDRPRLMYAVRGDERPGVDMVGEYRIALRVQDESQNWSAWAHTRFEAKPNRALWVELTWDQDDHDIDLHLIRGGDHERAFLDDADCYFANCVPQTVGVPVMHWGSSAQGDDPFLDVDDLDGLGPEVISIPAPERGMSYLIALHMFRFDRGNSATTATIKVFVDGEVVREISQAMPDAEDWWDALLVTWDDEVEVEVIDEYFDDPPSQRP